ncbi:MAG: hypothetical protein VXZ38_12030 [Planctomycetota bacterium]|nr:hypothetical protein [Planctomycetota bacterium]
MDTALVVGIFTLIIVGVILYQAARFLKGKLELKLINDSLSSGEAFKGDVAVTAKKPMRGQLKIALVARKKKRKTRANANNTTQYKWVEVYRRDEVLESRREFPAGFSQNYTFEILAPTSSEARQGGASLRATAEALDDGMMSSVLNLAASAADMLQRPIYWHIEARLEVDGVDLYTKQKVYINLN